MSEEFDPRQYLGPLINQVYIAQLCELDERVWESFRSDARERGAIDPASRSYLIVRMMHVAESTSNAIRMDATWELTLPAMSLVRDRYEQSVRFSWLVRNPDEEEFHKYERFILAKIRSITRNFEPETVRRFEGSGLKLPLWAIEPLSKEDREYLEAWDKLDLLSMATKRDSFPPIANNRVSQEKLGHWYNAVYRQLSSVSHYDRFSIEMIVPRWHHNGTTVAMGSSPHWPRLLILYTALLDIIQCYEATAVCFEKDTAIKFESLFMEWVSLAAKFTV